MDMRRILMMIKPPHSYQSLYLVDVIADQFSKLSIDLGTGINYR